MAIKRISDLPDYRSLSSAEFEPQLSSCLYEVSIVDNNHDFHSAYARGTDIVSSLIVQIENTPITNLTISGGQLTLIDTDFVATGQNFNMNYNSVGIRSNGDASFEASRDVTLSAGRRMSVHGSPVVINNNLTVTLDETSTNGNFSVGGLVALNNIGNVLKAVSLSEDEMRQLENANRVVTCELLNNTVGKILLDLNEIVSDTHYNTVSELLSKLKNEVERCWTNVLQKLRECGKEGDWPSINHNIENLAAAINEIEINDPAPPLPARFNNCYCFKQPVPSKLDKVWKEATMQKIVTDILLYDIKQLGSYYKFKSYTLLSCIELNCIERAETPQMFKDCTALKSVSLSSLIFAKNSLFEGGSPTSVRPRLMQITDVNLPNVYAMGTNTFYNLTLLTGYTLNKLHGIGKKSFYNCCALQNANFPAMEYCPAMSKFKSGDTVPTVSADNGTDGVFYGCRELTSISMPNCRFFNSKGLEDSTKLASISFGTGLATLKTGFTIKNYVGGLLSIDLKGIEATAETTPKDFKVKYKNIMLGSIKTLAGTADSTAVTVMIQVKDDITAGRLNDEDVSSSTHLLSDWLKAVKKGFIKFFHV